MPIDVKVSSEYTPRISVGGEFASDSAWTVHLSRSVPFQAGVIPKFDAITNAVALLTSEKGKALTLVHIGIGKYTAPTADAPEEGVSYTLSVQAPDLPEATATSYAPQLLSSVEAVGFLGIADSLNDISLYELTFLIDDTPGQNYYRADLYQLAPHCQPGDGGFRVSDRATGHATLPRAVEFTSSHASFREYPEEVDDPSVPFVQSTYFEWVYFSDANFDGVSEPFQVTIEAVDYDTIETYFLLVITAYSVDMFRLMRTLSLLDALDLPFPGQPHQAYSNVVNGLGIFAGSTHHVFRPSGDGGTWRDEDVLFGRDRLKPCAEDSTGRALGAGYSQP